MISLIALAVEDNKLFKKFAEEYGIQTFMLNSGLDRPPLTEVNECKLCLERFHFSFLLYLILFQRKRFKRWK